jgi:GNAT superfamily N-acetyltransferase
MLALKPACECCGTGLPPESPLARICAFECTFCADCTERRLHGRCPNCGGELLPRPRRRAAQAASGAVVRRVSRHEEPALLGPLTDVLQDAVHGGASVGFLAPLAPETARQYWQDVFRALDTERLLWVAERDDQLLGTVQLQSCARDNGRHRAEVQKLLVRTQARGQGVAGSLMRAVELEARAQGLRLLVLDTLQGSPAEQVYGHLGWQRAGEVPDYAAAPDGELFPTVIFFKQL